MNSHRSKVIWFIIISIVIVFLALFTYFFQTNKLDTSADSSPTYSQFCISGKINGQNTKKCYSNDATDKNIKRISEELKLEVDNDYKMEFTLGSFILNPTEKDGMQPVHIKCQYIGWGRWDWDGKNCDALCSMSKVYWLTVGLDTDVFDVNNFTNVSGKTQSVSVNPGPVDDSKTIMKLHDTDLSSAIRISGYASHKDYADLVSPTPSIHNYNLPLARLLSACGPENNEGFIVKYGGQHNPKDKVMMNFTPKKEYKGNIAGYNANGHKSSGDVYGAGIIVPINIVKSNSSNDSLNDNTDNNVINNDNINQNQNNNSNDSSSSNSSSQKTAVPATDDKKYVSDNQENNVSVNSISENSSSTSSNVNTDNLTTDSKNNNLAINDITKLVSTGSSIWFNLIIAIVFILGLGYFFFKK